MMSVLVQYICRYQSHYSLAVLQVCPEMGIFVGRIFHCFLSLFWNSELLFKALSKVFCKILLLEKSQNTRYQGPGTEEQCLLTKTQCGSIVHLLSRKSLLGKWNTQVRVVFPFSRTLYLFTNALDSFTWFEKMWRNTLSFNNFSDMSFMCYKNKPFRWCSFYFL